MTAKEICVNDDVSDVPVEARAAPTTGSGCHGWVLAHARDAKNSRFFRGSVLRRKHDTHPANARTGTGRVGRGRGKGGGVLLVRVTALFLGEGTRRVKMELAPWCGAIYGIFNSVA